MHFSILIAINFGLFDEPTERQMSSVNAVQQSANIPPEFSIKSRSDVEIHCREFLIRIRNMNSVQKGATPIPGIPDEKDINKPFKKGPTPIPGIPDDVIEE